jgi:hypothetical protein
MIESSAVSLSSRIVEFKPGFDWDRKCSAMSRYADLYPTLELKQAKVTLFIQAI